MYPVNAYESVNLANLNILIAAPLRSKGGPIPLDINISQNIQLYTDGLYYYSAAGILPVLADGYFNGQVNEVTSGNAYCPGTQTKTVEKELVSITDGKSTVHPLPLGLFRDSQNCLDTNLIDAYTTDASGLELVIPAGQRDTTAKVYTRDGYAGQAGYGPISDPHGNTVARNAGNSYVDGLTSTPVLSRGSYNSGWTFTYTDGTGTGRNVVVNAPISSMTPAFSCPGMSNTGQALYPLLSVSYPDGSAITLTWEKTGAGNYDGRLATVQVPTGATYTHSYSGGTNNDGIWCSPFGAATMTVNNGSGTWTFTRNSAGTQTTVTKPDGSATVYSFYSPSLEVLTGKVVKDTNGSTVLDTWTYCYDSTISNCNSTTPTNHPTWVRAYHYVPGVSNPAETDTEYDSNGNTLEVDSYDFGPTLVNKTVTTYGSWNGSGCTALSHIQNHPCEISVYDASNNTVANSIMNYYADGDRYYIQEQVSGGNYLSTITTFNANGTMATMTTPDGTQTTFAYNGTGGCPSSSPAFLPTSATNSIGTASMTWDCNGAVPLTTTDLNGLVTTTTYGDPLYRPTLIHDSGGQADVSFTYTSAIRSSTDMTFNGSNSIDDTTLQLDSLGRTLSIQHKQSPTSSNYDTVSFGYDSTGRVNSTNQACTTTVGGTCTTAAVSYTYDGMNRLKTKTVNTSTNGVLTYTYQNGDVTATLSPAPTGEHTKIVQQEYDGLGRLLSSCAVWTTGGSGSGACNQRTSGSGYLTKYTLDALGRATQVSRNAQTGATAVNTCASYDNLGRVTQSAVPESGGTCTSGAPSGNTSSFYYDAVTSSCSAFGTFTVNPGELAQTTDPYNNKNCYNYDGVGRLSNIYPISGPNQSVTPARYFCYDGNASCHGHFGSNLVGRLSDTGTTFSPYTTATADEQFGYDLYGRVTDRWQTSPGLSGSYFHTAAGYFDNGALYTLGGIPGVSGYAYNVDGEGRPYSATSNSTTIVSSVTYDAASNPLTITYGNGDTDAYTWDANSQAMTQWQFKLNGVSDTGVPTWNPNGTLKQLAITDSISGSTDSETCTTAHDDLTRITSFNCGSKWNESYAFSADYAGNVTKSGSLSFAPGYVASTNRFASGSGCTYDGNGNILYDCTLSQNYTWDSFGGMASSAGTSLVDDANGDMIQKGSGTYFVSSPLGELGSATSLTAPLSLKIPLPGGASITYDNAGNQQLNRKDFRGSTVLRTNRAARTLVDVFCYGPMGEIYCGTPVNSQFEGTFEDTSNGLSDFNATRYSGTQGRTQSPTGGANGYVKDNSPF
jgi:hypothetical protein